MRKPTMTLPAAALLLTLAACDRSTVIKRSITYQKDIMIVTVYEKVDGRLKKDYTKKIDIAGLDHAAWEALGQKVLDSLGALPNNGK